jgi:hypothetical protein
MDKDMTLTPIPAPLGIVEPHAPLLSIPPEGQLLYKMMTIENLLRSVIGSYLNFNRVDCYIDFPGSDSHDGQQLPRDLKKNAIVRFQKSQKFSAADYYALSRARTYACCFSMENTDFIWKNYANGSAKGKVCTVFDFSKLRATLNATLQSGKAALEYNGNRCRQFFSINYGIVEYVEWDLHQCSNARLPNPIRYTYLKNNKFSEEKELRVSLSAPGIGQFILNDGTKINFPPSLHVYFNFKMAVSDCTVQQILYAPDCDTEFLNAEFRKLGMVLREE